MLNSTLENNKSLSLRLLERRWHEISKYNAGPALIQTLLDDTSLSNIDLYANNIENYIGTAKLPVGIAGPLNINGNYSKGKYLVPLATTEGALVASYNRGAKVSSLCGGINTCIIEEGVTRSPAFKFKNLQDLQKFNTWLNTQEEKIKYITEATSNHCILLNMKSFIANNTNYLTLKYSTGKASGQNMVTVASQAAYEYIIANSPVEILFSLIEANFSSDKKASYQSLLGVRGKKVCAEVKLSQEVVEKYLHCSTKNMAMGWEISSIGSQCSGTVGSQAHYANGLAAFYIACGQDAACTAESAIGITNCSLNSDESLLMSVTMPNIMVATVGGGTKLPSQAACLDILKLRSDEDATRELAEITAALCLCGEISLIAAITSNEFTKAHQNHGRGKR
jgi:hydroxymethylglutaryl-CoA reductase (NADPH)